MARARRKPIFPIAISPAEAADALRLPVELVRAAVKTGALESIPVGKRIRIPVEALVPWLRRLVIK